MPVGSTFANLSVAEWVQGHATNLAPELLPVIQVCTLDTLYLILTLIRNL